MIGDASNPRFRFRRVLPRADITEIKDKVTLDSVQFNDRNDWDTINKDSYKQYPYSARQPIPPPPTSISLGGGILSPTREEMRSQYMNTFHPYGKDHFAKKASKAPDSELFPRDNPVPKLSMAQLGMYETGSLPRDKSSAQSARLIALEQKANHINVGFDNSNTRFQTTTGQAYQTPKRIEQPKIEGKRDQVSIVFDKDAGYGPHEKSLTKRKWAPSKPDLIPLDQHNKSFDTGYTRNDYSTTMRASYTPNKSGRQPKAVPPPCAEFSNDGPYVPKWVTTHSVDFTKKTAEPNQIDTMALRKVHWDQGHDKFDWPVPEQPKTARIPVKGVNQQESNQVFRGDGNIEFKTTTRDMIGRFSREEGDAARLPQSNEARKDHMYVGSDKTNYLSAAKAANSLAGTGKPAQPYDDISKTRGVCYARGGDWDRFAGKKMVGVKKYRPVEPTQKVDGSYYRSSHFDLDATKNNKSNFSTTYYEMICKPTLEHA